MNVEGKGEVQENDVQRSPGCWGPPGPTGKGCINGLNQVNSGPALHCLPLNSSLGAAHGCTQL